MAAPRVFVSHSHTDQAFTQRLVTDLHAAGAEVWVDAGGLTHGNFMQRIDEALAQCEWMVLVLTPNAITSEYVRDEVYSSLHRVRQGYMRDVIPILAAPCAPGTVPPQWDVLHRYDATGTTGDYGAALAGVLHAMGLAPAAGGAAPSVADPSAGAGAFGTLPAEHLPVGLVQLGFVGRVVNNVEVILPPLCDVAAGEFPMGSDPAQDGQAQANERPRHPVTLAAFRIGRFPLTVAEYACFVRAGQREPQNWQQQLGKLDRPVVNVSWSDAKDYCGWLGYVTGQPCRLPTEAEWEKAARWDPAARRARIYPWGDAFEGWRCNTNAAGKGTTTPVGAYPAGASPCGAQDMAGNVWEWTSSLLKPYPIPRRRRERAGRFY